MCTYTRPTERIRRYAGITAVALTLILAPAGAALDAPDLVYDTTAGLSSAYTGDLSAGDWHIEDIDGRTFQVQRWPGGIVDPPIGTFGNGVGPASLSATMHLVEFIDSTPDGSGPDDYAIFAGEGDGPDLVIVDEQGNTLEASVDYFELQDRTSSRVRPGLEGQGLLKNVTFSGPDFRWTCTGDLGDVAVCFAFTFAIEDDNGERVTLEDYLMSGGLGGLPVEIETWELRVPSAGCLGDLDGDGQVDQADLGILLAAYHINDSGDLNCDGATEQEDLAIFLANYGMTCP